MFKIFYIIVIFITVINATIAQSCPTLVIRKNSSCLQLEYANVSEAMAAIAKSQETITVTESSGGSADGTYTAASICSGTFVIFTKNVVLVVIVVVTVLQLMGCLRISKPV